ncbi:ABC transporter ATP-binding protein [Ponticaulis sp.]|uniref:ABC transporter ATP-binding protein n=1 Tax=Ponticaulis sp. TaxID=2020902 RepID=UPI0025CD34DD|nr:ABC transporter ATP-binding protein [Ponticaulis sp.]
MSGIVSAQQVSKHFGSFKALDDVSFDLQTGEIVGLLGLNGAGKSTTLSLLTGRMIADTGQISIAGHDITEDRTDAQTQFGFLPEGAPLFEDLSVDQHIKTISGLRGVEGSDQIDLVLEQFELLDVRHKIIETLSKGFKRRVALAAAFLGAPPILFLDEPTDGLDPVQKDRVLAQLRNAREQRTLLISTHSLEDVDVICDRVIILNKGRKIFDAPVEELAPRGDALALKAAFNALIGAEEASV